MHLLWHQCFGSDDVAIRCFEAECQDHAAVVKLQFRAVRSCLRYEEVACEDQCVFVPPMQQHHSLRSRLESFDFAKITGHRPGTGNDVIDMLVCELLAEHEMH